MALKYDTETGTCEPSGVATAVAEYLAKDPDFTFVSLNIIPLITNKRKVTESHWTEVVEIVRWTLVCSYIYYEI